MLRFSLPAGLAFFLVLGMGCGQSAQPAGQPSGGAPAAAPAAPAASIPPPSRSAETAKALSPGTGAPKRGGVLRGRGSQLVHLDTTVSQVGPELGLTYSRLLEERSEFYEDTAKTPGLVEKWEISPDGKTYTLHVRQGVKWHNVPPVSGRAFTAHDIAWNIDNYSKNSIRKSNFEAIEKYEVVDDSMIKITLKYAFAPFLDSISWQHIAMMPKEVFAADGNFRTKAIGTGPWMWDTWEKDSVIKLKPNPDYWQMGADNKPLPYAGGLEFYIFGDNASALAAFRSGKIDWLGTTIKEVQDLKNSNPNLLFEDGFRANAIWLQMNMNVKPWDDVRVRQAACYAIDKQEIVDSHLNGDSVLSGLIPSSLRDWAWQPAEIQKRYPLDEAKAKALLKEAGHEGLKVKVSTYVGPNDNAGTQIVQQSLNAVGFDATIRTVPSLAVGQEAVRNKDYELIFFTASSSFEVDDWTYLFWHSKGGRNFQGYNSPEMDRLALAQREAVDPAKRKEIVNQIQELMHKDMVACPLAHIAKQHNVLNPVVKNFQTFHWVLGLPHLKSAWVER